MYGFPIAFANFYDWNGVKGGKCYQTYSLGIQSNSNTSIYSDDFIAGVDVTKKCNIIYNNSSKNAVNLHVYCRQFDGHI